MKAFVIAGGVPQIELIKQLKARGISTVLVDGSPDAIARPYADTFYNEDIFNIQVVREIAEKEQVDFLLTVCADQVLLVAAQVSEMLGLPFYLDYRTALDVSDKLRMKRIFKEHSIPTTDYVEMRRFDPERLLGLRYPMVVKPVDAYSSKGVRKCEDVDALERYYQEAQKISRSGNVIVEEYFEGTEISVDAFVLHGKTKILTVTGSEKLRYKDRFVIYRGRYPVAVSEKAMRKIEAAVQGIAEAFGLENTPMLVQLLNHGDEISVLEFCARTGGNMKWLLIKHACGVDVIAATIDIMLGIEPDLKIKDTGHRIVTNDYIYCFPGVFDHLEGFDAMVAQGYINEYRMVRIKGTQMRGAQSSSDRIAGMNIVADSIEDFNEKQRIILQNVKVIDANGSNIMRSEFLRPLE